MARGAGRGPRDRTGALAPGAVAPGSLRDRRPLPPGLVLILCGGAAVGLACSGRPGAVGPASLVNVTAEPPGPGCAGGGQRIDTGVDRNGDGTLDPGEIEATTYVCTPGSGRPPGLVAVSAEAAGANCPDGGQRIDSGTDLDGDGVLDPGEISGTTYLCHGAPGRDGHPTLVTVVPVPPDAACPHGGQRIDQGVDLDDDGTLEDLEITSMTWVCNGVPGEGGSMALVEISDVLPGPDCANGGQRVDTGLDQDGDGTLDATEVLTTSYLCSAATAVNGGCTVLHGSYVVDHDLDLVAFANAGCQIVEGNLTITGTHLTSLVGLDRLARVGGDLTITENDALVSLSGLELLAAVDGAVHLSGNAALTDLAGLASLERVGRNLGLAENPSLVSLDGLESLTVVEGSVSLRSHPALSSIDALGALTTIGGALFLYDHPSLGSLAGLEALTTVGGTLSIYLHPALADLYGLANLVQAGGLQLGGLDGLDDLRGLHALTRITGDVEIGGNAALASLTGLSAVTRMDGSLTVRSNPSLPSYAGLVALTDLGGDLVMPTGNHASLTSFAGLERLAWLGGDLVCRGDCSGMRSLAGLDSLAAIDGQVQLPGGSFVSVELPSLTSIGGLLRITHLAALESISLPALVSVGADVDLQNNGAEPPALTLELGSLASVGNRLVIQGNAFLGEPSLGADATVGGDAALSFDAGPGLPNPLGLREVGGDLVLGVWSCSDCTLDLGPLAQVHGYLSVGGPALVGLRADVLVTVGGGLQLQGQALADLSLPALSTVGGTLSLWNLGQLAAPAPFQSLQSVGGDLEIWSADGLLSVDAFAALTTIGGNLSLSDNPLLLSLTGLHGVTSVGAAFFVAWNAALPECQATLLRDAIGVENIGGTITIGPGNDGPGGCP